MFRTKKNEDKHILTVNIEDTFLTLKETVNDMGTIIVSVWTMKKKAKRKIYASSNTSDQAKTEKIKSHKDVLLE